jgi:hypothetical protein
MVIWNSSAPGQLKYSYDNSKRIGTLTIDTGILAGYYQIGVNFTVTNTKYASNRTETCQVYLIVS